MKPKDKYTLCDWWADHKATVITIAGAVLLTALGAAVITGALALVGIIERS